MGWSTEVFDAHETPFTIFTDFGPRTPLAPDRLRLREKLRRLRVLNLAKLFLTEVQRYSGYCRSRATMFVDCACTGFVAT